MLIDIRETSTLSQMLFTSFFIKEYIEFVKLLSTSELSCTSLTDRTATVDIFCHHPFLHTYSLSPYV